MAATAKYLITGLTRNVQQCPSSMLKVVGSTRYSSFLSSPPIAPIDEYPEVEVIHNAPEWKYVERLMPPAVVPKPIAKTEYSSGWKPAESATIPAEKLKYFVARTKNHMVPVYLRTTFRGQRRVTVVRRIQGDIWQLERALRKSVEQERGGRKCATRINEMSGQIHFHGDYVDVLREYLKEKGF